MRNKQKAWRLGSGPLRAAIRAQDPKADTSAPGFARALKNIATTVGAAVRRTNDQKAQA